MEPVLSRHEILKELQNHKRYKNKTQKEISDKFGSIDHLRIELKRIQSKKVKKVLSNLLLYSDTTIILDDYIVSYLKLNPHLVTQYINTNGLYHVYYRFRDSNTYTKKINHTSINKIICYRTRG